MEKSSTPQYFPPGIGPPTGHDSRPGIGPPPIVVTSYPPAPTPMLAFGPNPQVVVCPSCHSRAATKVKAESSQKTHLMAGLLCLACCCCIPYCVDSCKNKNHYCQSCGAYLGSFNN